MHGAFKWPSHGGSWSPCSAAMPEFLSEASRGSTGDRARYQPDRERPRERLRELHAQALARRAPASWSHLS
jgi:hypothetical protein